MTQTRSQSVANVDTVELHFAAGLPGFPEAHRFELGRWGGAESPFMLMSAVDDPDLGFVLISPFVFYPEYEFDLDDAVAARLGRTEPADVAVLCIVTLHDVPADATVNLMGPIVVKRSTGEACQAVQSHPSYEVRAPLSRAA